MSVSSLLRLPVRSDFVSPKDTSYSSKISLSEEAQFLISPALILNIVVHTLLSSCDPIERKQAILYF